MYRSHNTRSLLVAVAATLVITGLSQCRFVDDTITGVDLKNNTSLSARSACVRECNEGYKDAMEAENERHKAAIRSCGNNKACRDAENGVHRVNKETIHATKKSCKSGCYNEGGGTGGQ